MDKTRNNNQTFPFYILWLIPFYLVNFALVIFLQCVFIHTEDGPLNEETVKEVEFFENTEILDIDNMIDEAQLGLGASVPGFVLYQTNESEIKIVRIDWNPFVFRYGVVEDTVQTVSPATGETEVTMEILTGEYKVTVQDGMRIVNVELGGLIYSTFTQQLRFLIPFVPMIIEYLIYALVFKKKRTK